MLTEIQFKRLNLLTMLGAWIQYRDSGQKEMARRLRGHLGTILSRAYHEDYEWSRKHLWHGRITVPEIRVSTQSRWLGGVEGSPRKD